MKKVLLFVFLIGLASSCKVDKEKSGSLPEVDIDVDTEAGSLPEYDVDWVDINVGTKTKTVKIPKVVVVMEEEEVEVPFLDFNMPGEENKERTLLVEAEVSGKQHKLEIKEIRASQKKLFVISTLEELETDLGEQTLRIQDQVQLNAPELDVKHIIVGEKADRVLNNSYDYVSSMNALPEHIKNAQVIYSK
ncbi:hypothetical protein [Maribacter sp. 2-571]|uniref:hypothetical protein n=1 Tax=Maribacter sp. 2-571 TaxID=3417569 RepID=UPI003D33F689